MVEPFVVATASPNAAHEPQAGGKRGEPLSEKDEPLFEDMPESTFWSDYLNLAEKRDRALVQGWNKSMDTLLISASLFSATVMGFLNVAFKGLSEDQAVTLLRQISAGLGNAQPEGSLNLMPFKASPSAVRVNSLWFASLTISLSSVVVIILAKYWIDGYDDYQYNPTSSRDRGRIRQLRYTNLVQWRIPAIIEFTPTLLLIALGLFFIGLIDFLCIGD
ncbi:hypothetical protein BOTBODRAFT_516309 [Botryobasidium botryosum FD-172 SS1]|uniref:DUF6535 domain-containing protein n=1 Tax=Botryobasidium botryosum (strain FD-172 SS1) TaxID=930990 RepID=A0A067MSK8_BOTB1|nr:hypothetical protein BOTBODRAFT_516309 [Botryobasidium botryosum FD-172 SS1]